MSRLSTVAVSTLVPALKVLSTTLPDMTFLSFVRTNAPPLPGLTCWNSTTVHSWPSRLSTRPFLRSFVVAMAGQVSSASGSDRRRAHRAPTLQLTGCPVPDRTSGSAGRGEAEDRTGPAVPLAQDRHRVAVGRQPAVLAGDPGRRDAAAEAELGRLRWQQGAHRHRRRDGL